MTDYYFQSEVVRLALVVSVIVSMLFYERMQLTSGGAIPETADYRVVADPDNLDLVLEYQGSGKTRRR